MENQTFDWHGILDSLQLENNPMAAPLKAQNYGAVLRHYGNPSNNPFATLTDYLLYGAAALFSRQPKDTEKALGYQTQLNDKTKAVSLFYWAQQALEHRQIGLAIKLLQPLAENDTKDPEICLLLASCYRVGHNLINGWPYIKSGLAHNPNHNGLLTISAQYHFNDGNLAEAERSATALLVDNPDHQVAFNILSMIKPDGIDDACLSHFTALAQKPTTRALAAAVIKYDIGRILDKRCSYSAAFASFEDANNLYLENLPASNPGYDATLDMDDFTTSRDLLAQLTAITYEGDAVPVFIVGVPRSGSTLVEQMLTCYPDAYSYGENYLTRNIAAEAEAMIEQGQLDAAQAKMQQWQDQYLASALSNNPGASIVIDKTLGNTRYIGFIRKLFPNAQFILMQREALDNALSIYFSPLSIDNQYAAEIPAIAAFMGTEHEIGTYWLSAEKNINTLQYEKLVEAPENVAKQLLQQLGLVWDDAVLQYHTRKSPVHTYSAHQVRLPVYSTSKNRWQNYADHIGPLEKALKEHGFDL
ncbi:MAG: hypothetical protein COB37_07435 [Kordiimonadales bacterium]|nr:MAG: hypothetical protein COB37_07435 [Kordiimonadales bacterium]